MIRRAEAQRGVTLIELLIVLAISTVVMIIAYDLLQDAMATTLALESRNELTTLTQRPMNAIQNAIYQAQRVFIDDAAGLAYYDRIRTQLPAGMAPAPNTLLPRIDTLITPDTGTGANRRTGNCLLISRQLPPIYVNYDHDNNAGTAQVPFPIDRYRFELFYLSRTTERFFTSNYSVDIVRARTIDFADYFQLRPLIGLGAGSTFSATQRTQIGNGLGVNGLTRAWDPTGGLLPTAAFYTINTGTGAMTLQANPTLNVYSASSMTSGLGGGSVTGKIDYTVGYQQSFGVPFDAIQNTRHPIPYFAAPDSGQPSFPSGFEIKVIGAGGAQQVVARLVMLGNYTIGGSRIDSQSGLVIAARGIS
ncbi:MAG TPA: prepilin-type N-terminal cleavage/methylation domain-containing protein [Thermoanaerobaculia bacterium]|nr:prepilin-type N-terminal cleavage/methylation domain-containing protein [Thermoanaerobaculia bacterium]